VKAAAYCSCAKVGAIVLKIEDRRVRHVGDRSEGLLRSGLRRALNNRLRRHAKVKRNDSEKIVVCIELQKGGVASYMLRVGRQRGFVYKM
jgi:hypothetical protein